MVLKLVLFNFQVKLVWISQTRSTGLGYVGLLPCETVVLDDPGIILWLKTTAVPFLFKQGIDLEEYSYYSNKAIAVEGGAI